ncbi:MAG: OmpA family protein [Gemmatimonadetes bacterium]|nr:OmpA family protein [Gemmatimonadota bacterium]
MSDGERRIVIVKKIKKKGGGHHGGSWKVAYADFVTAMMAFFLVMWIMGMDEGVREVVEGYFSNPVGFRQSFSGGKNPMSAGSAPIPMEVRNYMLLSRGEQTEQFNEAAEAMSQELESAINSGRLAAEFEITVADGGLRIELMEQSERDAFFIVGSAGVRSPLRDALEAIVGELQELPNQVALEGHTDGRAFPGERYSNWELSSDRANAARRTLVDLGLPPERIAEVRGYADRQLKRPEAPFAAENRRISLLLPYQDDLIRRPDFPEPLSAGGGGGESVDTTGSGATY